MTTLVRTMPREHASVRPRNDATAAGRSAAPEIVLDVSRLLSRAFHASPTGIDRVEMAYARTLAALVPEQLRYAAVHPTGIYGRLPVASVRKFLDTTEHRWETQGGDEPVWQGRKTAVRHGWSLRPRPVPPTTNARVLLQVSPHHLHHPALVAAKLRRERAAFVCMVHDIIPVTHPEYARPGGAEKHWRRLRTMERHADALLVNSHATLDALRAQRALHLADRPTRVVPLGVDPRLSASGPATPTCGYFVCLSTIEPRKNHLLLLTLWRSLVDTLGAANTPILYLAGRRGWENENVVDLLDRCAQLRGCVRELPRLPDARLRPLVAGALAVLMPSFAEGYGMPVAEALAAGIPVLASDIPAHREVGGAAPDYLDPIDGAAWRAAIVEYCARPSARRAAQQRRIADWRPPSWETHVRAALALVDEVVAG